MNSVKRLYILDFGLFQVHANGRKIGIPGYLIQTHDGRNILVDTGFPSKYAENAQKAAREDGLESFGTVLSLSTENLPAAQLALIGLTLSDVDTLVMTHTDIDHVGGIGDFPHATIVMHSAERQFERPRYWNGRSPIPWPLQNQYRLISDSDDELLCPGVQLLSTPGHAPGHLSLLVHLPLHGPVLLTGDAISRPAEIDEAFAGSWDEAAAQASAAKLMRIANERDAIIIYGHDPVQWPSLLKAPLYYD